MFLIILKKIYIICSALAVGIDQFFRKRREHIWNFLMKNLVWNQPNLPIVSAVIHTLSRKIVSQLMSVCGLILDHIYLFKNIKLLNSILLLKIKLKQNDQKQLLPLFIETQDFRKSQKTTLYFENNKQHVLYQQRS